MREMKISERTVNNPMNLHECSRHQPKSTSGQHWGDTLLWTQHTCFLIKCNCNGTRHAFKPTPNHIVSLPTVVGARMTQLVQFYDPVNAITGPASVQDIFYLRYMLCTLSLCHTAVHTLVVISHMLNISWHGSCKLAFLKWLYMALNILCIFLILAMLLVAGEVLLQLKMPTTTSVYVKIHNLN